ncbi:MAG: hypothetical protein MRZ33_01800 [Prevotella sp.]|nr:hypothetical protein [Prevotella sp.]
MKNLTWQNPEQLFVAQELINKVKSKCCGIKDLLFIGGKYRCIFACKFTKKPMREETIFVILLFVGRIF